MASTRSSLACAAALVLALVLGVAGQAAAAPLDLDPAFGAGGIVRSGAAQGGRWSAMAVLPDGRFLVAGQAGPDKGAVARYTAAGALDTSFAADQPVPGLVGFGGGSGGPVVPADLKLLPDGRILVAATSGPSTNSAMLVERLTADGHVDTTFGTAGQAKVTTNGGSVAGGLALQSTGAIVLAGRTGSGPDAGVVARFTSAGAADSGFGSSGVTRLALGGNATRIDDVAVDASDRVLVTGFRVSDLGRRQLTVARLNANGVADITYGVHDNEFVVADLDGAPASTNDVEGRRISVDAAGLALIAATVQSSTAGGPHLVGLARFKPTGVLDPAFGTGATGTATQDTSPSHVTDVADLGPLPGGGFAVAGRTTIGSTTQVAVAGYHADGTPDLALNPGHGATSNATNIPIGTTGSDQAGAIGLLGSGRLIVAGSTADSAGNTGFVARLGGGSGQAPIASFTSSYPHTVDGRPIRPGQTVSFDATASSDPDGTVASYEWDLDGNGQTDHTGPKVSMTYQQAGTPGVLLKVTDDQSLSSTTGATLAVVANAAPGVTIIEPPVKPKAGKAFTLTAFAGDSDGKVAAYAWDLDANGSFETDTGSTPSVTLTRDQAGITSVVARVTDDEGATAVDSATFAIDEGPCIEKPLIKIDKAVVSEQSGADAASCFHATSTLKDGVRTTTWATKGHFHVNGIAVDPVNGSKATLTYKRKVTAIPNKPNAEKDGPTLELSLFLARAHVTGTYQGTDFAFHDGILSWDLSGDTIKGFHADPNAGIGGLPLKVAGEPKLFADGSSTLDISPGAPAELLGKTPSKMTHAKFGAGASSAADGAFSFQVDEIPLGVVTLGPVTITYDGAGRWDITADASMAVPVPASLHGHLALVNGKVKSVSLKLTGAITAGPILITEIGVSIDFGPKVDADPECIKHVGLEDVTPDWKAFESLLPPGYKDYILAHQPQGSPLFHKIYRDYHTPNFALCGSVGLSVAEIVDANVSFGFARYPDPLPNVFLFHGQATLIKIINATIDAQITTNGYVHVNAQVSGGYPSKDPWIGWKLGLDFEYFKKQFNADVYAKIAIIPLDFNVGAELLASNKGIVACLSVGTPFGEWHPGGGAKWGHGPKLYLFGCDVNDYKVVIHNPLEGDLVIGPPVTGAAAARAGGVATVDRLPTHGVGNDATLLRMAGTPPSARRRRQVRAAAAQAAPQGIDVPAGLPGTVMAFKGAGAPPHVVLHGPKGETLDTGSGREPVQQPAFLALKDTTSDITQVAIAKPSGGRWTVEIAPDSSRLVEAIQADGVPATTARATVAGNGQNRNLAYHVTNLRKGEHLEFVEIGAAAGSVIGRVDTDGDGTLKFHPGDGPAGKRDLQAIVTGPDGYLRARIAVGTYQAPGPARPATVTKLKLKRSGRSLILSWPRDRAARTTQVDVRTSTGLNFTEVVRKASLKIAAPPAGTRLTLVFKATSKTGVLGRAATFKRTLPKPKPVKRKPVKTKH